MTSLTGRWRVFRLMRRRNAAPCAQHLQAWQAFSETQTLPCPCGDTGLMRLPETR
jgi:hypothetical protein